MTPKCIFLSFPWIEVKYFLSEKKIIAGDIPVTLCAQEFTWCSAQVHVLLLLQEAVQKEEQLCIDSLIHHFNIRQNLFFCASSTGS